MHDVEFEWGRKIFRSHFLKDLSNLISLGLFLPKGDSSVDAEVTGSLEGPTDNHHG